MSNHLLERPIFLLYAWKPVAVSRLDRRVYLAGFHQPVILPHKQYWGTFPEFYVAEKALKHLLFAVNGSGTP